MTDSAEVKTESALLELAERAVIALERIAGALAGPPVPHVPDALIIADLNNGMSLRQIAHKHGIGVGRVRGARARASLPPSTETRGEK